MLHWHRLTLWRMGVLVRLTHFHLYQLLALMPEGDHMNIIDPPGLTVMRIAGGRYRVTGAVSSFPFCSLFYHWQARPTLF